MKTLLLSLLIALFTANSSAQCARPAGPDDRAFYDRVVVASATGATWYAENAAILASTVVAHRRVVFFPHVMSDQPLTAEERELWDAIATSAMQASARESFRQTWIEPVALATVAHSNAYQAMEARREVRGSCQ